MRRELELHRPYRRAEIELLVDQVAHRRRRAICHRWRERLLDAFWQLTPEGLAGEPSIQKLLKDQIPLAMLTDVIAFAAPLRLADKQTLLAEASVVRRVQILVEQLGRLTHIEMHSPPPSFPPHFSDN